jgi:hypothetical protein
MSARTTPMERIMDSIAGEVRGSLGGMIAGPPPGLIKLILLSIATKAAARWIKNASSTEVVNGAAGPRRRQNMVQPLARVQVINT